MSGVVPTNDERLRPYVAGLALGWLRDTPASPWREVEGSLAFVDISGFTRLTERLADRGKAGAEEMSGILDETFAELLWVAYAYGAQLVKWGGDAVLLLFTGDAHAARAARAAYEMRRTMADVGRLTTSAGRVTLRMSVGIHSGTFHFFLVGSHHRELVITGPGATVAAHVEGTAEAGEIGLSPQTAALLDARYVGAEKAPGVHLLRRAPAVDETPRRSALDISGIDVASCLTAPTREHLLAGGTDGEHRQIAVAFVEFRQTDDLLAAQGPAALAQALHHVVNTTQEACLRHGVTFWETDISPNGGKIMLVGGAPRSVDDDAGAMLATARDVADAGGALPIRIGVNYGRVFSGGFGPDYRRTYSVKGDAVNLAARVMGKSSAGELWATEAVLERSRLRFDAEPLAPFMVKGKTRPVQAYRLGPPLQAGAQGVVDELPLVGRERELEVLAAAVDTTQRGTGVLVEVVGEPGIGKSRLLLELERRSAGCQRHHVVCDAYRSSTPYAPLRTLLRNLLDLPYDADSAAAGAALTTTVERVAPSLLEWLPLLAVVADAEVEDTAATTALGEKFRKPRLEKVTGELLIALLADRTLLVFEDVHLMDEASADVMAHLTAELPHLPWAVVVSRRTSVGGFTSAPESAHIRVDLVPLDETSARSMLTTASDDAPLRPQDLAILAERAEGNPLFLLQLVDAVRRTGSTVGLPDSVEGVITARIDELPPAERRWLRAAAVLGVRFDIRLLSAVLADDVNQPELARLEDFLDSTGGDELAFRHALVRDTAYEGLPYARRRELHALAGEALESLAGEQAEAQADLLSLHFLSADRFDKAWHYGCIAADRARAAYAYLEAATFYQRALDAAPNVRELPPATVAHTYEALGDMLLRALKMEEASRAYASARRGFRDSPLDLARVQYRSACAADFAGSFSQALRWSRLALGLLDDTNSAGSAASLRARILSHYGFVLHHQGRDRRAMRWFREAAALAERVGATEALATALTDLYVSQISLGVADRAVAEQALSLWQQLDAMWPQARLHNAIGSGAYFEGSWDEAVEQREAGRIAALKVGDHWLATMCEANVVEVLSDRGDLAEAERRMHDVRRMYRAFPEPITIASGDSQMARILARTGRFAEAQELYESAMDLQMRHGAHGDVVETMARIAECSAWERNARAALDTADKALALAATVPGAATSEPLLYRVRGLALAMLGDLAAAEAALERSLRTGRLLGSPHEVAWTLDAMEWLADLDGRRLPTDLAAERDELVATLGMRQIPRVAPAPVTVVLPQQRGEITMSEDHPAGSAATERRARSPRS